MAKKVLVRQNSLAAGPNGYVRADEEYTVSAAEAEKLVAAGVVTIISPVKAPKVPVERAVVEDEVEEAVIKD